MRVMSTQRGIGFLILDGITALDLVGPREAFASASVSGKRAYEVVRRLSRSIALKRNFLAVCLTVKSLGCHS